MFSAPDTYISYFYFVYNKFLSQLLICLFFHYDKAWKICLFFIKFWPFWLVNICVFIYKDSILCYKINLPSNIKFKIFYKHIEMIVFIWFDYNNNLILTWKLCTNLLDIIGFHLIMLTSAFHTRIKNLKRSTVLY